MKDGRNNLPTAMVKLFLALISPRLVGLGKA
jgi:hypothetical protein